MADEVDTINEINEVHDIGYHDLLCKTISLIITYRNFDLKNPSVENPKEFLNNIQNCILDFIEILSTVDTDAFDELGLVIFKDDDIEYCRRLLNDDEESFENLYLNNLTGEYITVLLDE